MNAARLALCALLSLVPAVTVMASAPVIVNQARRAFSLREVNIKRGETIRFANVDEFIHQLYISSPSFNFSSNEQAPGQIVDVSFTTSGTFEVKCEIHPKMLMKVSVE